MLGNNLEGIQAISRAWSNWTGQAGRVWQINDFQNRTSESRAKCETNGANRKCVGEARLENFFFSQMWHQKRLVEQWMAGGDIATTA